MTPFWNYVVGGLVMVAWYTLSYPAIQRRWPNRGDLCGGVAAGVAFALVLAAIKNWG